MKSTSQKNKKLVDDIENDNSSLSMITTTKPIEWSIENEMILVDWCDNAQCYKWLHSRAHNKYSCMHAWFTIPSILLSTISGTAAFAQSGTAAYINTIYISLAIGTINIFVGFLTTVQQYLKISELKESHRVSRIAWDKFARNIRIELAKAPAERMDAAHFLKLNRQEYDRLMQTSPTIHGYLVDEFKRTFLGEEGSDARRAYESLRKPDICDTIVSANENRHHWYLDKSNMSGTPKLDAVNLDIKKKEDDTAAAVEKCKQLQEIIKTISKKNAKEQRIKKMDDFVAKFVEVKGRYPIKKELADYFKEDREIGETFISSYPSNLFEKEKKMVEKANIYQSDLDIPPLENSVVLEDDQEANYSDDSV